MEPKELEKQLGAENLLVVDVSRSEIYDQGHIPGAAHIDYAQIIAARPPAMGELPSEPQLSDVFSSIGMRPENHVVAYDNEGGGRASRLLWTLDVVGHVNKSLLNGGWQAWVAGIVVAAVVFVAILTLKKFYKFTFFNFYIS